MRLTNYKACSSLIRSAGILSMAVLGFSSLGLAQESKTATTLEDVQVEFSEAFKSIGQLTAQERDEALAALESTLQRLDEQIEQTEARVREDWSQLSDERREKASIALRALRERRNQLSEAFGALSHGAGSAWDDLMAGVRNGWVDLEGAWDDAEAAVGSE